MKPRACVALFGLLAAIPAVGQEAPETSCLGCHGSTDWFPGEEDQARVRGALEGVHAEAGISCHDCHGGNPDPALFEDMPGAMDPDHAANPYEDPPSRGEIPSFCGRCHSDPEYMKQFQPGARVDQEREYRSSHHGKALADGDANVATCIDCHGVHGILKASNPRSSVYPTRVAETCSACHADAAKMAGYTLPDGRPLPVDQHARWSRSVHAQAMEERGDLYAPTCNDCHGNHGAAPPGVESVAFVCGQCHGREATLYRASAKHDGFELHNEMFLADVGENGCAECHEAPEPQASWRGPTQLTGCGTCHGNHSVVRPTVAILAPMPATPCAMCHEPTGKLASLMVERETIVRRYERRRDELLQEASEANLSGDERFDWLVDRAILVPEHGVTIGEEQREEALKPEFSRLFDKFRIGKTHFTYEDPGSNEIVHEAKVRCTSCHVVNEQHAAYGYVTRMRELTGLAAQADRLLLRARRGGVEVQEAILALDKAVDAQIQMQVLVHTFDTGEDSDFVKKYHEGLGEARAALAGAESAFEELRYRRIGLGVSLVFIVMVLIGLALKIREYSLEEVRRLRAEQEQAGS